MRGKMMLCAAVLLAAVFVTPACALDYSIDPPSAGDFGTATSDNTVYVGVEDNTQGSHSNPAQRLLWEKETQGSERSFRLWAETEWNGLCGDVDRSKNSALVPPGFGTPTSYLPGSGEPLTPNLTGSGGTVTAINPSTGGGVSILPPTSITGGGDTSGTATGYTAVTSDLYYNGGHLGTLKIPTIGLTVKVYQGTDSAQLAKGAGHFTGTSIWDGNVAVAAHNRGVNNHFGKIHTLEQGDTITFTTRLGTRTYEVTDVFKVSETDNSMLNATTDNCITLFTCVRDEREYRWCVRAVEV